MKHKLWGRLKEEAKSNIKLRPCEIYSNTYQIYRWNGYYRGYDVDESYGYMNLKDGIDTLNKVRDVEFYKLCAKALYKRRYKKTETL